MNEEYSAFLARLKEKCDLVDVIGSYIKLERRGYNYWACCPFHHEKTPSFVINAGEKYYHCFGCGASGDVIGFVKEYENVGFNEAVQILADRAKMEVPAFDPRAQEEMKRRKERKERLLALMLDTARFYRDNLYSGKADEHVAYLEKRKILPQTIKRFGLGASLDYTSLPRYLREKGYEPKEMTDSGACAKTSDGRILDAQGGRLIIPIINNLDEVVAFGGRIMKPSASAKYKNTRDSELFDKSKNLFNINLVKKLKKTEGIFSLILVEGYMDAISLYQAGFCNTVASMGTSLTKEQARLCKRYTDNVFISYDGDFAGQKANLRGLEIMKQEGLKVRVVPLPEGLDPDDVIKKSGADGYRDCLDKAMPLIDFRLEASKRKFDLSKTDEKREYLKEVIPIVREAESAAEREELLKKLSKETGVSMTALLSDLGASPAKAEEPAVKEPSPLTREEGDGARKAERFVLAACLFDKPYARSCKVEKFVFHDETLSKIAEYIQSERLEKGKVRAGGVFDYVQEGAELSEVLDLDVGDRLNGANAEKYFSDCVARLTLQALSEEIESLRSAYQEAQDEDEKREILSLIRQLMIKQKKYKKR